MGEVGGNFGGKFELFKETTLNFHHFAHAKSPRGLSFASEPFAIRVGAHHLDVIPPKAEGEALVISNSSYSGTKLPGVSARACARTEPTRFELQVKQCRPRVTLSEKDHKALYDLIETVRVHNPALPIKFHLKHTCAADQPDAGSP